RSASTVNDLFEKFFTSSFAVAVARTKTNYLSSKIPQVFFQKDIHRVIHRQQFRDLLREPCCRSGNDFSGKTVITRGDAIAN
ncbi:MAG: hypothetical protein ACTHLW_21465, partial [Verrucomicrobiota bacterium]